MRRRAVKAIVAAGVLALLFFAVDLNGLMDALRHLSFALILYLILIGVALIYISALKWQLFLETRGDKVSALRLFNLYMLGYFVNLLIPSYVGGDAVRSWYAGKHVGQHQAFAATVLERFTGFVAMLLLALVFVWRVDLVTPQIRAVVVLMAVGLAGATIVALHPGLLRAVERLPRMAGPARHLHKVQEALRFAQGKPLVLAEAMALSLLFHCLTLLNTVVAAYAVGWRDVPVGDLFVVLPLILLIGALPIAPSGLGIQEGAFYYFLQGLGATPAQALGVGLVLRAKIYLLAAAGGLVWLGLRETGGKRMEQEIYDAALLDDKE